MGRFLDIALMGRFTSQRSTGKQPIKKRGVKRFLILEGFSRVLSIQEGFFEGVLRWALERGGVSEKGF